MRALQPLARVRQPDADSWEVLSHNPNATRASTAVRTMSREAEEYLRASNQRGDHVVAGKTEYHEGGADLGMIWTARDRTLIIVGAGF